MGYFCALMLMLPILSIAKGELSLQIIGNCNGIEVPVSSILRESAGTNLTLICKLSGVTKSKTSGFDNKLSWGWRRPNIQFKNITDLQILACNTSNPLLQFFNHSDLDQSKITFQPLSSSDSGKYFCMSLKHKLFNIVTVEVGGGKNYSSLCRTWTDKPAFVSTKSSCTAEMFTCNSRTSCIKSEYVCDNVKDCNDGSDENVYLCGKNPCAGKRRCTNGRCILQSLCCSNAISCVFTAKNLCCPEIQENKTSFINPKTSNHFGVHVFNVPRYDASNFHTEDRFKGSEYLKKWNDINSINPYVAGSKVNDVANLNRINIKRPSRRRRFRASKKVLGIILAPFIALGIGIRWIYRKCKEKCKNGSSNNENTPQGATQQNKLDLPPINDETITKTPEATRLWIGDTAR